MSWRSEWIALSIRVNGLLEAGKFFLATNSKDTFGVLKNVLNPQAQAIFGDIKLFFESYSRAIPPQSENCLSSFIGNNHEIFCGNSQMDFQEFHYRVTALASFCSEFEYHISDRSANIMRQSERAFCHLQRTIVADETVKEKWRKAFDVGEIACEKLGSIHLLSHGIWCFKVNGEGERTDLVFQEPIANINEVEAVAEALVLTEWKIAKGPSSVKEKIREAVDQARRYSKGVLAGVELSNYIYIVIVTENVYEMPPDEEINGSRYKCINLAVNPQPPSKGSCVVKT